MKLKDAKTGQRGTVTDGTSVLVGEIDSFAALKSHARVDVDALGLLYVPGEWDFTPASEPIPTRVGAVIRMEEGEVFERVFEGWCRAGISGYLSNEHTQRCADECGFTVLFEGDGLEVDV